MEGLRVEGALKMQERKLGVQEKALRSQRRPTEAVSSLEARKRSEGKRQPRVERLKEQGMKAEWRWKGSEASCRPSLIGKNRRR